MGGAGAIEPTPAPPAPEATPRHSGLLLGIMCSAQLLLAIDFNVVNVANATIERDLHLNAANLQWTITAYALTFGGFLLLGGRMVDVFGRRRLFLWSTVGFALTSVAAGSSQNTAELIGSRVAQGLCAAVVSPAVLSLLAATFPEGRPRQRAYGMWATAGSFGGMCGLLFGGLITSFLGWRWVFFINAPIAAVTIAGASIALPRALPGAQRRRLDLPGAMTVTLGLGLVIYALGEAQSTSWTAAATLGSLVAAPCLLGAFYVIERRTSEPLLPLVLLRRPEAGANLLAMFQQAISSTTVFLTPLFMQQIWGYSPLKAALGTLPMPIGFGAGARLASRLVSRIPPRRIVFCGFCLVTVGVAIYAAVPLRASYWTSMFPATLIRSLGQGAVVVPVALAATGGVRREDQGVTAGLFNMGQQLGGALGLAAIATVAAAATSHVGPRIVAEWHGLRIAYLTTDLVPLVGAVVTVYALRTRAPEPVALAGAGTLELGADPATGPVVVIDWEEPASSETLIRAPASVEPPPSGASGP